MKIFILKGKGNTPDLPFTLTDLLPVAQSKAYTFIELANLINYTNYYSDTQWTNDDYISLYKNPEYQGRDFFTIRDTGVIIIPGTYIYPTLLTEKQIL
jgi:hypothetical protein